MRTRSIASIGLVAVGAAFMAIGIVQNEHADVLHKAIMICMECIGLG